MPPCRSEDKREARFGTIKDFQQNPKNYYVLFHGVVVIQGRAEWTGMNENRAFKTPSTIWRNLKTCVLLWKRIKCFLSIPRWRNLVFLFIIFVVLWDGLFLLAYAPKQARECKINGIINTSSRSSSFTPNTSVWLWRREWIPTLFDC